MQNNMFSCCTIEAHNNVHRFFHKVAISSKVLLLRGLFATFKLFWMK